MSIDSIKPNPTIHNTLSGVSSAVENRLNYRLAGMIALFLVMSIAASYALFFTNASPTDAYILPLAGATPRPPVATYAAPVVIIDTREQSSFRDAAPTAVPTTPPTAAPTPLPQVVYTDRVVYVDRVVEVEKIVTVEVHPTPTPAMPPGVYRICVYVEGVTAIYVNDVGIPGNTCVEGTVSLVTDIHFRITGR